MALASRPTSSARRILSNLLQIKACEKLSSDTEWQPSSGWGFHRHCLRCALPEIAADQGCPGAQCVDGELLFAGLPWISAVERITSNWRLIRASGMRNAIPESHLLRDAVLPADLRAIVHYFTLAADQGVPEGQYHYGIALAQWRGVPPDVRSAAHYLKLAADHDIPEGQFHYGMAFTLALVLRLTSTVRRIICNWQPITALWKRSSITAGFSYKVVVLRRTCAGRFII
jgi:hypothetical protein